MLNEINLYSNSHLNKILIKYNYFYKPFTAQTRSFSTSSKYNKGDDNNNEPDLDNLTYKSDISLWKKKHQRDFKKAYGGGFLGYDYIYNFGLVSNIIGTADTSKLQLDEDIHKAHEELNLFLNKNRLEKIENLKFKLKDYIYVLPETETWSILPVVRWESSVDQYQSFSISESIKITKDIDISLLADTLVWDLTKIIDEYSLKDADLELYIMGRPWLSVDEFDIDRFIDRKNLSDKFNEVLEKKLSVYTKTLEAIDSSDKISNLKNYPYKNIPMDNYGVPLLDKNSNLIGYQIEGNKCASIKIYYNDNNLLCHKVSIREFDKINLKFKSVTLKSWVDTKLESGFVREYAKNKYYYDINNNLINVETIYNYSSFPLVKKVLHFDPKIGTIDFETYGSNLGLGYHKVYAGGWATKDQTQLFYKTSRESSDHLVNRIFKSIFMNPSLDGYTFYAHNLGRFDSIFILKSLMLENDIEITPTWKDNTVISLILEYGEFKIKLLDSLQLIPGSLDNILKSFQCDIKKGYFPYSFVNENNLYYIGDKPSIKFFNNISEINYNSIPENNWNLKKETLSYLKADIEGLLEALIKFNNNIFNKYQLNITKFKTLPGLAFAAYRSSYLPESLRSELKIIKGDLEQKIRTSYFGGNVDVFINEISEGYFYDLNSQYPAAMLQDMPIGDPILSIEKNLDRIFGFVYGKITAPNSDTLRVPFIQYKNPSDRTTVCPRGIFKRLIFSEEIKYALKYGYTMEVEYCYQFKRGKDLFASYVKDHYEIKQKTTDPVQRSISKLFLNALYGRLGMKDIDSNQKIVDKDEAEYLDKNTNVSIISEINENKFFVKYKGKISDSIRKIYKKDPLVPVEDQLIKLNKSELNKSGLNKSKSVPAAVHIAAAISSYARMIINEYKNIPGNPCIMSYTDSAVLPYSLPDNLVNSDLGQMKLVSKIKHGIFIKKKLYCILDSNNQVIIKSSGVDSTRLNYNLFLKWLKGESVTVDRTNFNLNW